MAVRVGHRRSPRRAGRRWRDPRGGDRAVRRTARGRSGARAPLRSRSCDAGRWERSATRRHAQGRSGRRRPHRPHHSRSDPRTRPHQAAPRRPVRRAPRSSAGSARPHRRIGPSRSHAARARGGCAGDGGLVRTARRGKDGRDRVRKRCGWRCAADEPHPGDDAVRRGRRRPAWSARRRRRHPGGAGDPPATASAGRSGSTFRRSAARASGRQSRRRSTRTCRPRSSALPSTASASCRSCAPAPVPRSRRSYGRIRSAPPRAPRCAASSASLRARRAHIGCQQRCLPICTRAPHGWRISRDAPARARNWTPNDRLTLPDLRQARECRACSVLFARMPRPRPAAMAGRGVSPARPPSRRRRGRQHRKRRLKPRLPNAVRSCPGSSVGRACD